MRAEDASTPPPATGRSTNDRARLSRAVMWAMASAAGVAALWLGARQLLNEERLAQVAFHADEAVHLSCSNLFDLYFVERDWHDPAWFDETYGPDQPHLGHYLIGWQLRRAGISRPPCKRYDYVLTFAENREVGAVPGAAAVLAGRRVMAGMAMATLAAYVLIGFAIGRFLTGAIAALLLAANPLYIVSCSRVMLDAPLILAVTLSILATALAVRVLNRREARHIWPAVIMTLIAGAAIGAAVSVKLLGGITGLMWAATITLFWLVPEVRRKGRRGRPVILIGLAAAIAAAMLYGFNPYLWSYPGDNAQAKLGLVKGLGSMLHYAKAREAAQQWGFPEAAVVEGPMQRIRLTLRRSLLGRSPGAELRNTGLRLDALMSDPPPENVIYQVPGNYATIGRWLAFPLDLLLALLGGAASVGHGIRRYARTRRIDPALVIILWCILAFLSTWCWLPMDWDRYYLLPVTAVQFLIAAALSWPLERLLSRSTNKA